MVCLDKIVEIYKSEENDFINNESPETVKTAALYMFYHYYNADVTKLDELNNQFCFLNGDIADIIAINNNYYEDDCIDFITVLPAEVMMNLKNIDFKDIYPQFLQRINEIVANVVCKNGNYKNEKIINKLNELDTNDKTSYNIIVLCNYSVDIKTKIWYQDLAGKYKVKNNLIKIQILFEDDIVEEISDVESPKEFVSEGSFKFVDEKSMCFFGNEKSFLGFISAQSLKDNYLLYGTHGLFASNLRYYVKSSKIDSQIVQTIQNEPDNFCYFNNGIIITCDDYKISSKDLVLYNFSIVNGGQTTNLIGRTSFEKDFAVMCKVIKNKYPTISDKTVFLSKVAEASNTQKPIKAKDLIANRKEQRMLKIQFERANMFLQIKRGEKIPKDIYKEPWQNASNDQVAQMLYSAVYQFPGAAKNAKSKLLENEKIYNRLFKTEYCSQFFVSIQHIKVEYNNWVKKLKKTERYGSTKLGLAKNSDLYTIAVMGLVYKLISNKFLNEKVSSFKIDDISSENEELKYLLCQNDIGKLEFLNKNFILNVGKYDIFKFFDFIFNIILIPSYNSFKKVYPNYSYGNFVKSDLYYYNYVVPKIVQLINDPNPYDFKDIYNLSNESQVLISTIDSFNEYKPGLQEELKEYRQRISKQLNIKTYDVFSNNQLAYILKFKPKTIQELQINIKFNDYQCDRFGEAICKIINKYSSIDDYVRS